MCNVRFVTCHLPYKFPFFTKTTDCHPAVVKILPSFQPSAPPSSTYGITRFQLRQITFQIINKFLQVNKMLQIFHFKRVHCKYLKECFGKKNEINRRDKNMIAKLHKSVRNKSCQKNRNFLRKRSLITLITHKAHPIILLLIYLFVRPCGQNSKEVHATGK